MAALGADPDINVAKKQEWLDQQYDKHVGADLPTIIKESAARGLGTRFPVSWELLALVVPLQCPAELSQQLPESSQSV